MRFLGHVVQFSACVSVFCVLGKILPSCILSYFTWIAHIFLCFTLTFWIIDFTQHYFFKAKVDVKNKAVLITGCDTGFGHAMAKIFDLRGYKVFACCLDETSDGAYELREKCSSNLKVIQMNVTDDKSVETAVNAVKDNLGKSVLWAVINNAGVLRGFHTELSSIKDYEMCMEVNAIGVVRVTRAFLPFIRKSKGRVVNVCSMASRTRVPFMGPYIMSKSAAAAFTEVLMQEMRDFGIHAISIEPEFFKTPMCSRDYVMNFLNESVSEAKEDVKSAYGNNYIEKSKSAFWAVFSRNSSEVDRVYNAIESAVSLQNPADIYKPTRNLFTKVLFFLNERAPRCLVEIITMILFFALGVPAPRTGTNILCKLYNM